MKKKKKIFKNSKNKEILKSIERGAKETALFLKGKIKLANAKDLLKKW